MGRHRPLLHRLRRQTVSSGALAVVRHVDEQRAIVHVQRQSVGLHASERMRRRPAAVGRRSRERHAERRSALRGFPKLRAARRLHRPVLRLGDRGDHLFIRQRRHVARGGRPGRRFRLSADQRVARRLRVRRLSVCRGAEADEVQLVRGSARAAAGVSGDDRDRRRRHDLSAGGTRSLQHGEPHRSGGRRRHQRATHLCRVRHQHVVDERRRHRGRLERRRGDVVAQRGRECRRAGTTVHAVGLHDRRRGHALVVRPPRGNRGAERSHRLFRRQRRRAARRAASRPRSQPLQQS